MKKVRFIYNPRSGETLITEWLDHIVEIYQSHGLSIMPYRLCFNEQEEEALLDGVDESFHHLLIAGGDGTVNYVINQMKRRGVDVPVAVLPTGTANDFAHMLGVPVDIAQACRRILAGTVRRVDLGRANEEYFVNVFSCGLFTEVSQRTPTILKNTFGKLAYYVGGLGELPKFRKMHIEIESDGGNYEGSSLIFFVFNGRTAGQMRFAYLSELDDGLLDILVLKGDNPIETIQSIFHFMKRHKESYPPGIVHFQSKEMRLYCYSDETTDIDGQAGPRFPIHITCEAGALQVLCPARRLK
ncbi:MAG: YegS/Rv2252/BmrU family lipid kinase [Alistipes sp.]|nr:YegS/Rv2252/BmrU family lipid kinase [Alistipes sp.]